MIAAKNCDEHFTCQMTLSQFSLPSSSRIYQLVQLGWKLISCRDKTRTFTRGTFSFTIIEGAMELH
jgi:hypothetical protein